MTTAARPILLAEDNPNDVELTLTALRGLHLANEIVVVHDGTEALDFLQRRGSYAKRANVDPAVVILDLKMPRVDGLQVLREIRANDAIRTVPVVILTSSREESDLLRGYALGANAFVVKPVDFDEFVHAVSQLGVFWTQVNEPPPEPIASGPARG